MSKFSAADNSTRLSQRVQAEALFSAIRSGNCEAVVRLVPTVLDLDAHTDGHNNDTPLVFAARFDLPLSGFKALLERSDARHANSHGRTALMFAAWGAEPHSPQMVRLLLPVSNPQAVDSDSRSALHFGIRRGVNKDVFGEIFAMLLPVSDLEQADCHGRSPLACARAQNFNEAVQLILAEMARRESTLLAKSTLQANGSAPCSRRL